MHVSVRKCIIHTAYLLHVSAIYVAIFREVLHGYASFEISIRYLNTHSFYYVDQYFTFKDDP
jgi:hypothetical protein